MTSVNEVRSAEDLYRTANDLNPRPADHQLLRAGSVQVRSTPDTTERHRILALGLDTTFPSLNRPYFVSSENITRVQHLLLSDAHYIQHGTIRQLPELIHHQRDQQPVVVVDRRPGPSLRTDHSPAMAGTGSSGQSRSGSYRNHPPPPPGLRDVLMDSENMVMAMAALEKRTNPQNDDEDYTDVKSYDSSVDDPNTFPALPSITRRQSEQLDRRAAGSLLGKWSLPDLRRIESTFCNISSMEGITDPDVILRLLQLHPEIDFLYMSPTLKPIDPKYSPYLMHLAYPGRVDILNCCVVTRKNVMRYIKGKEPRCLSLKRWSFEQRVMIKLRKIAFVRNFKQLKAFYALGDHLDMSTFGKTKRKLRSQLLTCIPSYAETLLLVRTMCLDMASLSLIHVDAELTYTLGEFLEEQEQYSQDIVTKLERCLSILLHLISRMCWDDVISAGLAEESRGRRWGAPKRVNELRKMQRLRQSSQSAGIRQNADDVNIGMWIKSNDELESQEMEIRKKEKCIKLFRFIYLADCLIRSALYEVFVCSLKTSATYLTMHLETFPSDEEIRNIVKGYVGDLNQADVFSISDNSDDGGGGKGPGRQQEPKTDASKRPQHENRRDDMPNGHESSYQQAGTDISHGVQGQGLPDGLGRFRASVDVDVTPTSTVVRMSSSAERLGIDVGETDTMSTLDNAMYSSLFGESDLTDSLQTSSSTLSEEHRNINPMGTSELYSLQGPANDDLIVPVIIGTEMRIFRLHDVQTQNQYTNTVDHQGTSTADQDGDIDDVTVIERLEDIHQNQLWLEDLALATETNVGQIPHLKQSDSDDNEDDLTITSDERSNGSNRSKNTQSNNFVFLKNQISRNSHVNKGGDKERAIQIGKRVLQTSIRTFNRSASDSSGSTNVISKRDFSTSIARKKFDEALTILQEQGEIYETDSSDSISALLNDNEPSLKEAGSFSCCFNGPIVPKSRNIFEEEISGSKDEIYNRISNKNSVVNKEMNDEDNSVRIDRTNFPPSRSLFGLQDTRETNNAVYTDMFTNDFTYCRGTSASYSEANPRALAKRLVDKSQRTSALALNVIDKSQRTSALALSVETDKSSNDSRMSGIFNGLFTQNPDSSVDFVSESDSEHAVASNFQILGGAIWVSDYIGNYMTSRNSKSSSVDDKFATEADLTPLKKMSLVNAIVENVGSTTVLKKSQEIELGLDKELDNSEDETTASFDSACKFGECSLSEIENTRTQDGDRNVSHHKPTDQDDADVRKTDGNETIEEMRDQTDDEPTFENIDNQMMIIDANNLTSYLENRDRYINIPIVIKKDQDYYEKDDNFYINANTSPNIDDDDNPKTMDIILNKESNGLFNSGNIFSKLNVLSTTDRDNLEDFNVKDFSSGVRKDGGKRKSLAKIVRPVRC